MNTLEYKRRLEEMKRNIARLQKLYDWEVINWLWEDSFQSPKDIVLSFFRWSYEIKELILDFDLNMKNIVEDFCRNNYNVWLAIDIANQKKYWTLTRKRKTNANIWGILTWLNIFCPKKNWRNWTEVTIMIDGVKQDCLNLMQKIFKEWDNFLKDNNL